jgi:hypothetical protein
MSVNTIAIRLASTLTVLSLLGGVTVLPEFINTGIRPVAAAQMTLSQFQKRLFEGTNLTPDQQAKINKIRELRNDRLKVALTTPQFNNFTNSQASGKSMAQAIESLKPPLSKDQKARINSIMINTTGQIRYVMTQDQQSIVKANLKAMNLKLPEDYLE